MATFTESRHAGEFILSEAQGSRSRDNIVAGGAFNAGDVLGRITASGKYVRHTLGASDGSQTAVAIAIYPAAADGDKVAAITRAAEVNGNILRYGTDVTTGANKLTVNGQLAAAGVGIIVR